MKKKIREIQFAIYYPHNENIYYDLLIKLDGLMTNYHDYMTTEPIACDEEVKSHKRKDLSSDNLLPFYIITP